MPERSETIAYCHSCGSPMNVAAVAPFSNVTCPSCGKHTRVKREFGPYTLVRRHAVGGMSMVFVAHDHTLDREVALKILSEEYSSDERRVTAFEEEARITASFSHPNVVRVLTTGKAFGRLYIAMELVPGGHFEHQIREKGKISELEMLPLAIEVAEGLKAAHAAGLIHRDIKPGNILLDAEGHAKIVDFGLALVTQGGKAQATEIWATPYYVPPETIEGYPEDFRSDIYAFGATLYHALAGQPSCGEESMGTSVLREAKKKVIPLGELEPTLSAGTCAIVEKAMAYSPDNRFSSYEEMIAMLQGALKRLVTNGSGVTETSGSAAKRRAMKKQTERITLAAAAVVLLGAVSGGIWWVTRKEPQPEAKTPVVHLPSPEGPDPDTVNTSATEIAKSYREARAAVEAGEFSKAAEEFVKLRENPSVQEPTRTWAGVEAVVAHFLDGESAKAKVEAKATALHARSLTEDATRLNDFLIKVLDQSQGLPAVSSKELDTATGDAPHVMAWMVAGLKNWEQGMSNEAKAYFGAVASAKLSADDSWLELYQKFARDYLDDGSRLSEAVFEKLPADVAGCESAVAELDKIVATLKTRGRARFNVRAWQLDLAKHAKLLAAPKPAPTPPAASASEALDLTAVMAKLGEFAADCRFSDAVAFIKSLPADPEGATRASLLMVAESSAVFLSDLEEDLAKQPMTGEFSLKSGETARKISIDPQGGLLILDTAGTSRSAKWGDFSADAIIGLHRIFVAIPKSEFERVRRHECAISYDWLAGNRERALAVAGVLSQGSPEFKQHWETVSSGLPK
ncbi:MAG: serine/threonine-protein kinase [Luteolibacter sp.]|uniref:serine/threonine-protein kinase n=1 Tax=Luteolibacter sp. TaxID=1962973 RepID=UPI003263E5AD